MSRPIPSRAPDLRQARCVVLVGFVHLHLERGTRMPGVKADDVEPSASHLMHEPQRHGAGLDANAGVLSRMPPHHPLDLYWVRAQGLRMRFLSPAAP